MHAFFVRLRSHWMRNLLAMIQVALAVAAVTTAVLNVLPALRDEGTHAAPMFLVRFGTRFVGGYSWTPVFYAEDAGYLIEHGESIEAASVIERDSALVQVEGERYAVHGVMHVSPIYANLVGLRMVHGSFFSEDEMPEVAPSVAVISDRLADLLFADVQAIGRTLNLRPPEEWSAFRGFLPDNVNLDLQFIQSQPGTNLTIVGVFEAPKELDFMNRPHLLLPAPRNRQPLRIPAEPRGGGEATATPTLSVPSAMRFLYEEILVMPRPGMERQAEQEVLALLQARLAGRSEAQRHDGYDIMFDPVYDGNQARREAQVRQALIIGGFSLVALMVAGLAVFTTTTANLTQRVRMIGLARAIGATRWHVMREVMLESALLSSLGGVLGVVVSYPMHAWVFAPLRVMAGESGPGLLDGVLASLIGILLAMAVGGLAALYPAWSVARLAPAEAWREGPG